MASLRLGRPEPVQRSRLGSQRGKSCTLVSSSHRPAVGGPAIERPGRLRTMVLGPGGGGEAVGHP
ncbi:MAG: hypothetical protein ABW222_08050, partial [Actinomycetota bacterium]